MNFGEPGRSNWMCHGCAARAIADRDRVRAICERVCRKLESACEVLIDLGDEYEEEARGELEDLATIRTELERKHQ
jgi:hypothetical protein